MSPFRRSLGPLTLGLLAAALVVGEGPGGASPLANPVPAPIPLPEPAGQTLLLEATARRDHGPLAQWFETQTNLAYCGVASAVMALNSLAIPAPAAPGYGPYRFWTQSSAFSIPGSGGYVRPEVVAREGMTLAQLQGWLAQQPDLVVERFHGDQLTLLQWRGFLPTAQFQAELGTCQVFLNTPKWNEAFGNVVVEALACGVPVAAYARGGPGELVREGQNGALAPADDLAALELAVRRAAGVPRSRCREWFEQHHSMAAFSERIEAWLQTVA